MHTAVQLQQSPRIKIERGIPMPSRQHTVWPFRDMAIGDSFAIPAGSTSYQTGVGQRAYKAGRALGYRFSVRTMPDGTKRVSRIA